MKLELEVGCSSHLKSLCKDVCKELATNFFIHDAIKILPKLPVSGSIAFSVSAKFGSTFNFTCHECHIIEVFSALKRIRTYLHTARAYERGIQEVHPSRALHVVAGNREDENTYAEFFCNQAQNY